MNHIDILGRRVNNTDGAEIHRRLLQSSAVEEFRERNFDVGMTDRCSDVGDDSRSPANIKPLYLFVPICNVAPLSRDAVLELCIEKIFHWQKLIAPTTQI